MTPHNKAKKGEIAKVVLMPGDPLRAKYMAEKFLKDAKLVNEVRGMYCYTGTYQGTDVSIMGHGMGIPSIGIYSYELYKFYDVELIMRVGSTGSYNDKINVGDVVVVDDSYSESTFADMVGAVAKDHVLKSTPAIVDLVLKTANEVKIPVKKVRCHASDSFYGKYKLAETIKRTKSDCVDMESFGLFANAQILNKKAVTLLTCSDSLVTGESLSPEDRKTGFADMFKLALETAVKYLK